ncbi:hypothetical protein MMC09_003365 [Bachmanniomyces sp. S44760]|nr:hypothetical protein [Bachmanniomyces sp. S44760]
MPLTFTAAHSSRITKPRSQKPPLKRSSSLPFKDYVRRKPVGRSRSKPEVENDQEDLFEDRLDDVGTVARMTSDLSTRDVVQIIKYIRNHMFDEIPERGGMNSTRIAEVLNFRRSLPPIVTNAHVHALSRSPTTTEREIAELAKAGVLKKMVIPGRGNGSASVGDGLVLIEDWQQMVETAELDLPLAQKYVIFLKENPLASTIAGNFLTSLEAAALMRAGFLTSSRTSRNETNTFASPIGIPDESKTSIPRLSRAASGSVAAVGGEGAFLNAGGGGAAGLQSARSIDTLPSGESANQISTRGEALQLSVPSTGPLLRLLISARTHLISLLSQSKFKESPVYPLRERWDGGIAGDDAATKAKRYRGEFVGVLPGRTRKWKQFYGLNFDWVLAEALGAGLIEDFETGSVGRGVRVVL